MQSGGGESGGGIVTRVFIIAASPVVRAGLETLIAADARFTVVGSSDKIEDASQAMEEYSPDVVLLELERPDDETLAAFQAVDAEDEADDVARASPMVVLADDTRGDWIAAALRSGVRAVLPRTATRDEIVAAIEATVAGLVALNFDAVESLLPTPHVAARTQPAAPVAESEALTRREIEVLGMLAEGLGNKTIAYRLNISEHTIKFHVSSIFAKLGAISRTEAVMLGIRRGLIML